MADGPSIYSRPCLGSAPLLDLPTPTASASFLQHVSLMASSPLLLPLGLLQSLIYSFFINGKYLMAPLRHRLGVYVIYSGRALGLFTVMLTNGSHLAPIIGGLVGQYCGWRWTFKFAAIADATMVITVFFLLPETLYIRKPTIEEDKRPTLNGRFGFKTYISRMRLYSKNPQLDLKLKQFVWPSIRMAMYPSVLFPALYYASQYGFASILPAVTVAHIFQEFFHWDTLDIGLGYGLALSIGASLGELAAGMVVDAIVKRAWVRNGGRAPDPEVRLQAIWTGEILLPVSCHERVQVVTYRLTPQQIGLLIYGFTLQYATVWIAPLIGMGIACFGIQVITTSCYSYIIDCYPSFSSESSQFVNLARQEIGMTFAFYAIALADRIGYQFTFLFFALCGSVLAFIPIVGLMWKGREIREKMGTPQSQNLRLT